MARLLTNRELVPALKRVFEYFRAGGGDPHLLEPVLAVQPDYLRAAMDELNQKLGSVQGYFPDGLSMDADGQQRLRDALIES
jgi:protein-tyrosine phosphatase